MHADVNLTGVERTCFERQIQRSILRSVRPPEVDKEVSGIKSVKENNS